MFENISKLKTKRGKTIFFFVLILLVVIEFTLYLLLHFKTSWFHAEVINIGKEVLADIIAATITSGVVALLIFLLLPTENTHKSVEVVDSTKRKELHKWALKNTNYWLHIGHTARWVRLEAMSYLSKISIEKGIDTSVKIIVFNPVNYSICEKYSKYRNRISFKEKGDSKSPESIIADIIAAILSAKYYNQNSCGLTVDVFLTDEFYIFREDISNNACFITQPDPRSYAIALFNLESERTNSELYYGKRVNFNIKTQLLVKLDFTKTRYLPVNPNSENVKKVLNNLNIRNVSDKVIDLSIQRYSSNYHPYK